MKSRRSVVDIDVRASSLALRIYHLLLCMREVKGIITGINIFLEGTKKFEYWVGKSKGSNGDFIVIELVGVQPHVTIFFRSFGTLNMDDEVSFQVVDGETLRFSSGQLLWNNITSHFSGDSLIEDVQEKMFSRGAL